MAYETDFQVFKPTLSKKLKNIFNILKINESKEMPEKLLNYAQTIEYYPLFA